MQREAIFKFAKLHEVFMRIGVVRHYKVVDDTTNYWMSSKEFSQWVAHYNRASIEGTTSITASDWDSCYSSDMDRAVKTAEQLFNGEAVVTSLLREIEINPLFQTNVKLHRSMWLLLGRLGWIFNHSSQENRPSTSIRANRLIDLIEESNANRNVLIVTHGAFMIVLKRVLLQRGYRGDSFNKPENGKIYMYEKDVDSHGSN